MYDRILIPTDGSDGVEAAVEHAIELTTTYDADLHALYVMDVGDLPPPVNDDAAHEAFQNRGEAAIEAVERRASEAGIESITEAFVRGVTHESIVTYAEDHEIDLIVMGTHGRSGLDRLLIGSVTENVIRNSAVPVLTVRITTDDEEEERA